MKFLTLGVGLGLLSAVSAAEAVDKDVQKRLCLLEKLTPENASMTVAEVMKACETPTKDSFIVERAKLEQASFDNPYSITPHRPNYLLAGVMNSHTPSSPPFEIANNGQGTADRVEAEFQISLKFPFVRNIWDNPGWHWMAGYTNRSFWQVYNGDWSRPFRETNHEPETWVQFPLDTHIPGTNLKLRAGMLGFNHQSNGQTGQWSRSWNRILGTVVVDNGANFAMGFTPWWRIPEDAANDDNPDILHYMGNFELQATYRFTPRHQLTFMLRNNLEGENNRGAYELSYGFPLPGTDDLRIYLQAFHGYGKSLIDYNIKQTSLGVGLQLVDW